MRYKGFKCEKCGVEFTEQDDVVVCPICGAPHHRSCWLEDNACAHSSEHESGYQWVMPQQTEEKKQDEVKKTGVNMNFNGEFTLKNGENVLTCPRCGALNCENDVYCMRCGFALREQNQNNNGNMNFDGSGNGNYQQNRRIEDFNRFGGLDPNSELDGIPVQEYSDFVGGNTPGKIIRKISTMERFGKKIQVSFPALFIGPVWFFWRKMKKEGLIFSAILLALSIAGGLLQINTPFENYINSTYEVFEQVINGEITTAEMQEKIQEYANIYAYSDLTQEENIKASAGAILSYLAEPGIAFACSLSGIYLYRKKVKASILKTREECTSMEQYRDELQKRGGTSVGLAVFGAIICAASLLMLNYLPVIIVLMNK